MRPEEWKEIDERNKKSFEKRQSIKSWFYKLDFFAEPMHYNYEGKDRFASIQGVVISLLYYTVMIIYI